MKESILTALVFEELSEYYGKYEITFQFWGEGNNNVWVEKDGVDLWDSGGFKEPIEAMIAARDYLDRINNKKRDYNPNF